MQEALRKRLNGKGIMISVSSRHLDSLLSNKDLPNVIDNVEMETFYSRNKVQIGINTPVNISSVVITGNYADGSGHNEIVDILRDISGNFPKFRNRGDYREYKL